MKYPALLSFDDILPQLEQFDAIIDVRSPAEFAEDHIPGAINCPVLDDDERIRVGTMYKQVNAFEAKKVGAALVARNIARHIEAHFSDKPRDWKPLIYCWRGGNRSGALTHVLARIGWPAIQLDGGYKAYRRHVNESLTEFPGRFQYEVVCGPTGSGKSRLLEMLASMGEQVLDLEQLAAHRGSVLGNLPTQAQPTQKAFESKIWQQLRSFKTDQTIFIESESKKIGNLRVPDVLIDKMRAAPCIAMNISRQDRVSLLLQDYDHFITNPALLNLQLACLTSLHSHEKIAGWQQMALTNQLPLLVDQLLVDHYDPAYRRSIEKNFSQFAQAQMLELPDISNATFMRCAQKLQRIRIESQ